MNILILSAMTEEIDYLVKGFNLTAIDKINGNDLFLHTENNKNIYILNSGIGKVASSITTSMMLNKYDIDKLISIGTSGALTSTTSIGDFVVGKRLAYHDADVTAFGYEIGQLPNQPKYFVTTDDDFWNKTIEQFASDSEVNVHYGDIVTGDQFISSSEKKQFINNHFENGVCTEMESTAIVHTALCYGIDTYALRSISDNADSSADVSFDEYLFKVCKLYKKFVDILLSNE
ncbi:5'-methylthioadenosine/adenosylhomocysteine nucleosidase [Mollicutes bacterium LVI A0039]|nr:5'-methylthioadenosine/adenosylhomocysteine nucleosidase [Mollicutes bacterium LVI A0039]